MAKHIGTLGKYDIRIINCIELLILMIFYKKKSQKCNLSVDNKNLK